MSEPEVIVNPAEHNFDMLRSFGRLALGAGSGLLGVGIALSPLAAMYALSNAQVDTNVAQFRAEASFSDTYSSFAVGPARAYVPRARHGIAMQANIVDAPQDISTAFTAQNFELLAGQSSGLKRDVQGTEERLIDDAVQKGRDYLLIGSFSLWGVGYAGYRAAKRYEIINPSITPKQKLLLGSGLVVGATLATTGLAQHMHEDWAANQPHPHYTQLALPDVQHSLAAGAFVDTQLSYKVYAEAIPRVKSIWSQLQTENGAFLEKAVNSWSEQEKNVQQAPKGDYMIYAYADDHGNDDATKVMGMSVAALRAGAKDAIKYVVVAGDRTEGIDTPQEYDNEKAQMDIIDKDGSKIINADGNHDELSHSPFKPAPNKTVTIGSVKVLAVNDTNRQPWGGEAYYKKGVTEEQLGKEIRAEADKTLPDIVVVHEPDAVASFVGLQSDMVEFMKKYSGQTISASQLGLKDIPAGIIIFGHDHIEVDPVTIINSDGTQTSIVNLGTAGGKVGDAKPNYFSLPVAPPLQVASTMGLYVNEISNRLDGWQRYRLYPSASIEVTKPMQIAPLPGRAFAYSASSDGIKTQKQRATAQSRLITKR